jgi:hypothetical protein
LALARLVERHAISAELADKVAAWRVRHRLSA